jgi:hypothetical protein
MNQSSLISDQPFDIAHGLQLSAASSQLSNKEDRRQNENLRNQISSLAHLR